QRQGEDGDDETVEDGGSELGRVEGLYEVAKPHPVHQRAQAVPVVDAEAQALDDRVDDEQPVDQERREDESGEDRPRGAARSALRSEEHTSELQSRENLV